MSPIEPEWVNIPAGIVTLGAPRCPDDFPLHHWRGPRRVEVKEFQIARYAVTRGEYERFLNDTRHPAPVDWQDHALADPRQPVCGVSAEDADAYCRWLRAKTAKAYRLPHADEWETAARGGLEGKKFPWGDDPPDGQCHFGLTGKDGPLPVGSFPANGFGLYDMAGNIWQWLADRYVDVADDKPGNTPTGKSAAINRVLVGGSFMTADPDCLRVAYRHEDPPDLRHRCLGFRVAMGT